MKRVIIFIVLKLVELSTLFGVFWGMAYPAAWFFESVVSNVWWRHLIQGFLGGIVLIATGMLGFIFVMSAHAFIVSNWKWALKLANFIKK